MFRYSGPTIALASAAGILRIAGVGHTQLAVDQVVVQLDMEGILDLARRAGVVDQDAVLIDMLDLQAIALQPFRDLVDVRLRQTEPLAEFGGLDPVLEQRRVGIVLLLDKLLQRLFLLRRALQQQQHVIQLQIGVDLAAIVQRINFRTRIAGQRCEPGIVNLLRDNATPVSCTGNQIEG